MVMGIGIVIVILVIAAVLLFRAGSGLFGGLFLIVALSLFVTTPMGDGLPGMVAGWFQGADTHTSSVVEHGGEQ